MKIQCKYTNVSVSL